jgi:YggT family protein
MYIAKIINNIFYFYFLLIILRIFLTWIPSINWHQQPFKTVREVTDLYLNIFRRFIPPVSGLDFSPIIAIIALQIIQVLVVNLVASILG